MNEAELNFTPQQIKDGIAERLRQRQYVVAKLDGEIAALRALCPHPSTSARSAMGEVWHACDFCNKSV